MGRGYLSQGAAEGRESQARWHALALRAKWPGGSLHDLSSQLEWPAAGLGVSQGRSSFWLSSVSLCRPEPLFLPLEKEGVVGAGGGFVHLWMHYLFIHLNFFFFFFLHTGPMLGAGDMETIRLGSCPPELTVLQAG